MDLLNEWLSETPERARILAEEELIVGVSEEIWHTLVTAGISKADLADKLGVSRPRITKLLDGSANMTLRTLADIAFEIGKKVSVVLADRHVTWEASSNFSSVFRFEADERGCRTGTFTTPSQWNEVNENRFENAAESIAA